MSRKINLGKITAYADAVAGGFQGTKAQWNTLMASYGSVAQQAASSASDASDSATAAAGSASNASQSATAAAGSATAAASSASDSADSATAAAGSATAAAGSATAAAGSASAASTSAGNAETSAGNSANSATAAAGSASDAADSATAAAGSATAAAGSATAAATSATNAGTSATSASGYATQALNYLNRLIPGTCPYSVGDILITLNTDNPNTRWAGTTWQELGNYFLYGTTTNAQVGDTGGAAEASVPLPEHSHTVTYSKTTASGSTVSVEQGSGSPQDITDNTITTANDTATTSTEGVSSANAKVATVPPYIKVKMWKLVSVSSSTNQNYDLIQMDADIAACIEMNSELDANIDYISMMRGVTIHEETSQDGHSDNFARSKRHYDGGYWSDAKLRNAVTRWITAAEYAEITGNSYN